MRGRGCIVKARSWSTHLASSPLHGLCFVGVLSKLVRLRFYVDL